MSFKHFGFVAWAQLTFLNGRRYDVSIDVNAGLEGERDFEVIHATNYHCIHPLVWVYGYLLVTPDIGLVRNYGRGRF